MLATIIAYSIFIANPMGTLGPHKDVKTSPYFFHEETQMREYKTYEECEAVASKVRLGLSAKTDELFKLANTAQKESEYRIQKAKYDSLKCMSIERKIDTDYSNTVDGSKPFVVEKTSSVVSTPVPAKAVTLDSSINKPIAPKSESAIVFRIGRLDDQNNFHGTVYNTNAYGDNKRCAEGYKKTFGVVVSTAMKEGATDDSAASVLAEFKGKYTCHEVLMEPGDVVFKDTITEPKVSKPIPKVSVATLPIQLPQVQRQIAPVQQMPEQQVVVQHKYTTPEMRVLYDTDDEQEGYHPPREYSNSYIQQHRPYSPLVAPTKRMFVSEIVFDAYGNSSRVNYPGSFPTAAKCYQAMEDYFHTEENRIQHEYHRNPTTQAYKRMSMHMFELNNKRNHTSCVSY